MAHRAGILQLERAMTINIVKLIPYCVISSLVVTIVILIIERRK